MSIIFNYSISISFKFLKSINSFIAHIGVGIFIIGVTISSIYKIEKDFLLSNEENIKVSNVDIYLILIFL